MSLVKLKKSINFYAFFQLGQKPITKDALSTAAFLQCDRGILKSILQQQNVLDCSEADLFRACIAWARAACQKNGIDGNDAKNLKTQLGHCFYLIRFGAMKGEEIAAILSNKVYESLFTRDELAEIMRTKWDREFKPNIFEGAPRSKKADVQKPNANCHVKMYSIDLPDELIGKQNQVVAVCNDLMSKIAEIFSLEPPAAELSDDGKLFVNIQLRNIQNDDNTLTTASKLHQNVMQASDINDLNRTRNKRSLDKENSSSDSPTPEKTMKYDTNQCCIINEPATKTANPVQIIHRKISIPSRKRNVKDFHLKIIPEFLDLVPTTSAPAMASKMLKKKKTYYAIDLKFDVSAAQYLVE